MNDHAEYAKNRLALSAMRQALGLIHRDDRYFDRMYGGAIAQTPLGGDGSKSHLLQQFRRVLEETDRKIHEIAARGPRDEDTSLAEPIVKHELTDKEAHDLEALHLAMHVFRHGHSLESGEYDKGMLFECMLECVELKNQFFGILHDMEVCIHYERRPSTEPEYQAARLALPFIRQRERPRVPKRTAAEEEDALNERLEEMAREAGWPPKHW